MSQRTTSTGMGSVPAEKALEQLADAYGTTLESLAGRRAFRGRRPVDDLPPAPRGSW
jgi:hypothetical protein